jgi:lysophospholipase L1-like esterase
MSARGRFLSVLVTTVIALAGFVTGGALPAAAASGAVQYVALGDSYAAGTAAGGFPNCPQNADGYPGLLDSEQSIHLRANATCSGAMTSSVATTQLSALKPGTKLVTLTVGAADLGLSRVLAACTTPGMEVQCSEAIEDARDLLPPVPGGPSELGDRLASLFADVVHAAPKARVVVTGYPLLFSPTLPDTPTEINAATILLNDAIQQAVEATKAPDVDIVYVDVTVAFLGHGIGDAVPFINNLPDPNAFHPNAAGYSTYAALISAVLPPKWLDGQTQSV